MAKITRHVSAPIEDDLNKKMVLLAGPRQCGKTTMASQLIKKLYGHMYNWDILKDRKELIEQRFDAEAKLWVFDELHKYRQWRNWLKGVYDEHHKKRKLLVTGSAKLNVYSRGGDSLQGRYYFHRLHPFTLGEILQKKLVSISEIPEISIHTQEKDQKIFKDLLLLGGFPEPFLSASELAANRWRMSYNRLVIEEEVMTLERIVEIDKLAIFLDRLPAAVGSPLSINSFREDLEVSFDAVKRWVTVFDNLYLTFRLPPFGSSKIKAVKKEQKLYFWDWTQVESQALRAENIVALHLLRLVHWAEDVEGCKLDLRYYRNTIGHEVDFLVLKNLKPWMAIEVKSSEESLHPGLKYLLERGQIPYAFQLHLNGTKDFLGPKINGTQVRFMPIYKFLAQLP